MLATNFKKWDTILGWIVFFIALITYGLTVEPTASFWDCGEYISTSAKLQVGHPPGAPFFQMMGAFFSMFAPSPEQVALMVNYMSVFSSAFTVLLLFWSTTLLVKKIIIRDEEITNAKAIAILGSGLVGALTYSDSFWFNAVEAEVYAMAMLFMSLMFWLGLKWIDNLHSNRGNKWLILISLVVGLSFGVHFMALLTIPAIGMMYFFQSTYQKNIKNFIIANIISVAILLFIFKLLLPYTLSYFGYLEVFFVNSIGLPFNSGTIIAGISIILAFYFLLTYTRKKNFVFFNTAILCIMFVFIGFSTWIMIPIRANADTVINENSPTDARLLLAYYNLEQYPETHLIYGPMYSDRYAPQDQIDPYMDDKPKYERDYTTNKYIIVNQYKDARIAPNRNHVGFLPRMWSAEHAANYMKITGLLDFKINSEYITNNELRAAVAEFKRDVTAGKISHEEYVRFLNQFKDYIEVQKPTLLQNLKYLFQYQMGYMYGRYFMWNFTGRQDDIQGRLDNHGNWMSGIKFIDELRLGSQENLPSDILNNKARNTYYFLPLILGIIGLLFQIKKSKQQFWILFILFIFTGLALKVYLNERPFEPRERDYALVGSFYVFSIWIGMGVYGLFEELKRFLNPRLLAPAITLACILAVPTVMAYQNWDDHDRSNRYTAQSMAKSYLDSIQEDAGAMLFTIGDNDTFALWYAQEIEGYRTDVRTINTSLFATDWYIDQMKRKAYESDPIPSQLRHDQYAYGVRDAIYFQALTENTWNIKDFMNWVSSDDPRTKVTFANNQEVVFYPTNKIRIPVNKENVLKSGLVKAKDSALILDYIDIELPKSAIGKNRLLMLDIIANNDWKRPIYFTGGSYESEEFIWMKDYLQLDGLVYKLVPIKTAVDPRSPYDMGRIDSDLMYSIVMGWEWGNMESSKIYHDPETRKLSINYRGNMARLVETLIKEGKKDQAKTIIELAMQHMPVDLFGFYSLLDPYVEGYYKIGEPEKARKLFLDVAKKYQESLNYFAGLSYSEKLDIMSELELDVYRYSNLLDIIKKNDDSNFAKEQIDQFNKLLNAFGEENMEDIEDELDLGMPLDSIPEDSLENILLQTSK